MSEKINPFQTVWLYVGMAVAAEGGGIDNDDGNLLLPHAVLTL